VRQRTVLTFTGLVAYRGYEKRGPQHTRLPPFLLQRVPSCHNSPMGKFIVLKSPTYTNWFIIRGSIADGLALALKNIKDHVIVYPLKSARNPPATEFVNITGKSYNTVAPVTDSTTCTLYFTISRGPSLLSRLIAVGTIKSTHKFPAGLCAANFPIARIISKRECRKCE
jgi:hypothetical protein